jgi:membrane protease YdiL (CAAX protease family)
VKSRALFSPEPARGWIPWGALAPLLAIVFVLLPMIAVMLGLKRFDLVDADGNPMGNLGLAVFLLVGFGIVGLLVLGWVKFVERRPFATIGLTRPRAAGLFLRGLAIGCAAILFVILASWLAGAYEAVSYAGGLRSPAALLTIAMLLVCFALQSSVEELVFRGWQLSAIARKFNVALAVILSSAVFCLLHFSPGQPWLVTLNLVLFASFACTWALRAGNIWGVMGWHAGWNWLLATGFELPVTGFVSGTPALLVRLSPVGPDYLTGGAQGPEGSVFCTLFFVVSIAAMLWRRPLPGASSARIS